MFNVESGIHLLHLTLDRKANKHISVTLFTYIVDGISLPPIILSYFDIWFINVVKPKVVQCPLDKLIT